MAKISRNEARKKKHLRIRNKISGTAQIPRVTVFKSLKNLEAQLIDDVAGKTIVSSSTLSLKMVNGGNIEAATKLGEDFAAKVLAAGVTKIVFDRSGYIYHGRIKALAEKLREKGVKF